MATRFPPFLSRVIFSNLLSVQSPARSAHVCLLLLIRWNRLFKTAGRAVSQGNFVCVLVCIFLCACVCQREKYREKEGQGQETKTMTQHVFLEEKMCRFRASEIPVAQRGEEKSWSITAVLDKGTPPFPLSRPGMYGCVNPRLLPSLFVRDDLLQL